jgi:hypothetical protein
VSNYQLHWYIDISVFVDDAKDNAPLMNAPASWPFCRRSRQPATPFVREVAGARQDHVKIADNAKALG